MAEVERELLTAILDHANGNQSLAADYLGISRPTLIRKMRATY